MAAMMFSVDAIVWASGLAVLGAVIGSFVAALVIRWPQGRSVAAGRSTCDTCGRTLGSLELIPLVSAFLQRGRCRKCRAPIDPRHWQIELIAATIGGVAGFVLAGPAAITGAMFGWLLLPLAALDLTDFWLPNRLTMVLAMGGLVAAAASAPPDLTSRVIGGAIGFGSLWMIAVAYRKVRGREGLGSGDPKLLGAIGLWVGWQPLPAITLLACLIGLAFVAWQKTRGRRFRGSDRLPFGALLAIAAYPAGLAVLAFGA